MKLNEPAEGGVFSALSDDELRDLGAAMDSAAGEGAFANHDLAQRLVDEASRRGIQLELAYDHGTVAPEDFMRSSRMAGR